jgi:hypothetical protein
MLTPVILPPGLARLAMSPGSDEVVGQRDDRDH